MAIIPSSAVLATIRQSIATAIVRLASHPEIAATARQDSELLLLHMLAAPRTVLFTDPGRILTADQQTRYETLITRRLTGEPIQYITGHQEFYGLELRVTPAVLIPRPETEVLVEAALGLLSKDKPLRIADIGTGSGAMAIAIAHHLPMAQLAAVDLSSGALAVARENAAAHHVEARIRFLESDLLSAIAGEEPFDAILSNPPYIPDNDRATLHVQVREHEPASALFAGPSGLDIYERLIPQAFAALKAGGLLVLEIGHGQRDAIAELLSPWDSVQFVDDLQQIPRVAIARKPL